MLIFIAFLISQICIYLGFYGIFFRRDNLIITMVCLEIALLGVALLFALGGLIFGDISGLVIFFVFLVLAGVESALGLAFVISYYRMKTSIRWSSLAALRG